MPTLSNKMASCPIFPARDFNSKSKAFLSFSLREIAFSQVWYKLVHKRSVGDGEMGQWHRALKHS